jgi:hypothetical protein
MRQLTTEFSSVLRILLRAWGPDSSFELGNLLATPDQDTQDHDKEDPG